MMVNEKVEIHGKISHISKIKNILYSFVSDIPKINAVSDPDTSLIIFRFNIPSQHHPKIIEKILESGIHVEPINSTTKKVIRNLLDSSGVKNTPSPKIENDSSFNGLSEFEGKDTFEDILQSAQPYLQGQKKLDAKTRNDFFNSIIALVNKYESSALGRKSTASDYLDDIIEIASSTKLRFLNAKKIYEISGNAAINVSVAYQHLVGELIEIANNRNFGSIINIKAAIAFGDKLLQSPEEHEEDLVIAIKRLNTKWLQTAFDVAQKDLTEEEITKFHDFLKFISAHRG